MAITDGKKITAMALAATVAGLSIDTGKSVARRVAWKKPLNDARYGLTDQAAVARLKANLASIVPAAADWIANAPIVPENTVEAVAGLIAAAAAYTVQPPPPPQMEIPTIVVKGELGETRTRVRGMLGAAFANKASDHFLYRARLQLLSGGQSTVLEPQAVVMEMQAPAIPAWLFDIPALGLALPMGELLAAGARIRAVEIVRAAFLQGIAPLRATMEMRLRKAWSSTLPEMDVCWLNGAIRIVCSAKTIADFVADPAVKRVGLPRLLEREMGTTVPLIGAPALRAAQNVDGSGIQVAVLDGECQVDHPSLLGRIVQKKNYTAEPWGKADRHATAVAGIIGSANPAMTGIAPAVTILNYKLFPTQGKGSNDFAGALAIQRALEDGARVANCSWGAGPATLGTPRLREAVDQAWRLGMVLVKSAGNKGPDAATMTSPCEAAGLIVVGASTRQGTSLEPYSSRGPALDRPGPDLLAPGGAQPSQIQGLLPNGTTGAAGWGTSLAAPHITGLAALLLQANPTAKPDQIRDLLLARCHRLGVFPPDAQGAGLVGF